MADHFTSQFCFYAYLAMLQEVVGLLADSLAADAQVMKDFQS